MEEKEHKTNGDKCWCGEDREDYREESNMDNVSAEMPKYKCHKEVWALKIANIELDIDKANKENRETDGSAVITPAEKIYAPFRVNADYVHKHNPQIGGYYVLYEGGYKSFSPAVVFEDGYTRI